MTPLAKAYVAAAIVTLGFAIGLLAMAATIDPSVGSPKAKPSTLAHEPPSEG
jgi:hypothetical protein